MRVISPSEAIHSVFCDAESRGFYLYLRVGECVNPDPDLGKCFAYFDNFLQWFGFTSTAWFVFQF